MFLTPRATSSNVPNVRLQHRYAGTRSIVSSSDDLAVAAGTAALGVATLANAVNVIDGVQHGAPAILVSGGGVLLGLGVSMPLTIARDFRSRGFTL